MADASFSPHPSTPVSLLDALRLHLFRVVLPAASRMLHSAATCVLEPESDPYGARTELLRPGISYIFMNSHYYGKYPIVTRESMWLTLRQESIPKWADATGR